jgi:hypothetical protein
MCHAEPRKCHSELGSESLRGRLVSASKINALCDPESSSGSQGLISHWTED